MKMVWKVLGFVGLAIVFSVAGRQIAEVATSGRVAKQHSEVAKQDSDALQEALQRASNTLNSGLPRIIDKERSLDTTIVGPGKTWTYFITFLSIPSSAMTQEQLRNAFGEETKKWVCTSKEMQRTFVRNGVEVVYHYRGNDGGDIGYLAVSPSECR